MSTKTFVSQTLKLLLLTLLSISFYSCGDEDESYEDLEFYPYSLYGYVTDYHTGKPLANVSFNLSCIKRAYGMGASNDGKTYYGVAKTDSKGYYKIRIPKRNKDVIFDWVYSLPQNIPGYHFMKGEFCVGEEWDGKPFDSVAVRADISAISYGYLKVIMTKVGGVWNKGSIGSSYEQPRYNDKFLYSKAINDSMKYDFYIVAASTGWGHYYNNDAITLYEYEIINPRDTVTLILNNKI